MKKSIISALFVIPQLILAQTLTSSNGLRAGDELCRAIVWLPESQPDGDYAVWNMQDMLVFADGNVTTYAGLDSLPGFVTAIERFAGHSYLIGDDGAYLLGQSTRTSQMSYDIPEQLMRFPMHVGDSIKGLYGGRGTYCDKLFVREYGSYITKLDASGCMILPEGDTLHNVCRLTTDRLVYGEAAPSDSMRMVFGDSIPEYTQDSIQWCMSAASPLNRVRVQRWYAEGYRYPILETTECRSAADGRLLSEVALYYPPEKQESQLPYDGENEHLRLLAKAGRHESHKRGGKDVVGRGEKANPIANFSMLQSHETSTVTITYDLDTDTSLRAVLASTTGVVYCSEEQTHEPGSGYSLTLSYSGLPHGQYVVCVSAGGFTQTAKFSTGVQ